MSRSLASTHLRKLVDGGLVVVEPKGRLRLYQLLAGQSIADALEVLLAARAAGPGAIAHGTPTSATRCAGGGSASTTLPGAPAWRCPTR